MNTALLFVLHCAAIAWPLLAAAPWLREANRCHHAHMDLLRRTPLFPLQPEKDMLTLACAQDRRAQRKSALAVGCAVVAMALQMILIHLVA